MANEDVLITPASEKIEFKQGDPQALYGLITGDGTSFVLSGAATMYYKPNNGLHYFQGGSGENRLYVFDGGAYSTYSAKYLSLRDSSNNVDVQLNAEGSSYFVHRVGFGVTVPLSDHPITYNGTMAIKEQGSAENDTADYGQLWVKNTSPNKLYFTDDDGTDHDLTAGGGGSIGGSLSDNYIPIGTAADTIGNFVLGLTENNSIWIGSDPSSTTSTAEHNVALGITTLDSITTGDKNVAIGYSALTAGTTTHSNVAIGYQALDSTTAGSENVAIGAYAGQAIVGGNSTTGGFNVFVGHTAGYLMTGNVSYGGNTMVGHAAGYSATGADRSTGIGGSALYYADGAKYNTAVGRVAGAYAKGTGSTHVGDSSGYRVSGNYNTSVGFAALSGSSSGTGFGTAQQNVAIGRDAMLDATSATENVAIGNYAAAEITGGDYNTAIGYGALRYGTTTNRQVAIGYAALNSFTQSGDLRNTAVGMYAMLYPRSGSNNVAMGYGAMQGANSTYDSDYNVALGSETLFAIAGADNNTAVGFQALRSTTDASNNTAMGLQAMYSNTTGINNTAVGAQALYTNVDGDGQTAIGYKALISSEPSTDGGGLNTAVGFEAGFGVTTGHSHVIVGYRGARSMTGGERNIYIGSEVGYMATDGSSNTVIGNQASYHISGASNVTSLGRNAGYYISGNNNTFLGMGAARGVSTGGNSVDNVAIGATAGYYFSTANYNVAVGNGALAGPAAGMTGDNNVAVGRESANSVTSGHSNVFMGAGAGFGATTAAKNVIIGMNAGYALGTHQGSTIIGFEAGRLMDAGSGGNVALGHQALYSGTQNYQNTAIGINAGRKSTGASANNVYLGSAAGPSSTGAESNKLYIHNAEGTPLIGGDFSAGTVTIDGKLAIGTATPTVKLDVRGTGWPIAAFHGTSEYGTGIQLYNTHTTDQAWAIIGGGTSQSNYPLKFYDQTNAVYRMVLDNTGKLGIGVTSPTEVLDVRSANNTLALFKSSDNRGLIQVADDDTTASIVAENSTLSLGLTSSISASNLNIDAAGNAVLGATATVNGARLHVNAAGNNVVANFESTDGIAEIRVKDDTKYTRLLTVGSQYKIMPNDGVELMVLDGSANTVAVAGSLEIKDGGETILNIMETGTNGALLSGANSAGLYFATQSGTRLELTGNHIIKTGQTIDNMVSYSTAAVHTATTATQAYQIEAQATPNGDHTTTLNLPNGNVGGERFTVTCIGIGNDRLGSPQTGKVLIGGVFINGTNLLSPTVTSITGATAAGASVMQVKTFEFTWVASQFNPSNIGGWVYTVNTM